MLPHRLHRAVRPPVALPPQLAERGGHLGPGPGPGGVRHLPAGPVDGHGEVGVLGQGPVAHAPHLGERLPAERPDGTGHHHDAPEGLVHPRQGACGLGVSGRQGSGPIERFPGRLAVTAGHARIAEIDEQGWIRAVPGRGLEYGGGLGRLSA